MAEYSPALCFVADSITSSFRSLLLYVCEVGGVCRLILIYIYGVKSDSFQQRACVVSYSLLLMLTTEDVERLLTPLPPAYPSPHRDNVELWQTQLANVCAEIDNLKDYILHMEQSLGWAPLITDSGTLEQARGHMTDKALCNDPLFADAPAVIMARLLVSKIPTHDAMKKLCRLGQDSRLADAVITMPCGRKVLAKVLTTRDGLFGIVFGRVSNGVTFSCTLH